MRSRVGQVWCCGTVDMAEFTIELIVESRDDLHVTVMLYHKYYAGCFSDIEEGMLAEHELGFRKPVSNWWRLA